MLVKLTNQALDYAWGSKNLISDYFGLPATGKPMAEIWFGTHDGSPTQVIGQGKSLHELLLQEGKADRLEFLLKILAAEAPLSIQAHPNPEQAVAGFAKENAAGISIAAANRNYKDDRAKPELIVALSESFDALVGFADSRLIIEKLQELLELSQEGALQKKLKSWIEWLAGKDGIRKVFLDSLTDPEITPDLISELVDLAEQLPALVDLVSHLNAHHEGDRGIATALLLNRVTLARGEAVFVPAGMPHAYLSGLGVEVMLASDNVLRGGLTTKHVDVAELAEVVVFEPVTVELTKSAQL
ncbi:MAG: mannose-6-phosphate isomerase, class I, partial [Actinobacteria bacterium]|nr:mannose-6-phosphate isomerase, class I [Actinomycetota bacterium]